MPTSMEQRLPNPPGTEKTAGLVKNAFSCDIIIAGGIADDGGSLIGDRHGSRTFWVRAGHQTRNRYALSPLPRRWRRHFGTHLDQIKQRRMPEGVPGSFRGWRNAWDALVTFTGTSWAWLNQHFRMMRSRPVSCWTREPDTG